jgi:DNA-binding MarR family transcriptional regulator
MAHAVRHKKRLSPSPEQETYLNLARTHDYVQRELVRLLEEYGLTAPKYHVLRVLRDVGGKGLPCLDLGKRLLTHMPDVSRLVDRLEDAGLVERSRIKEDGRVVLIAISDAGRHRLTQLDKPILKLYKKLLGHLGREELNELNRLLTEARHGG